MTVLKRLLNTLVLVVPTGLMIVLSVGYLAGEFRRLVYHPEAIVSDQLSLYVGREASVGRVRLIPLGQVRVEDVRVAQNSRLADGAMITASLVNVKYDLKDAVFGKKGAQAVKRVEIRQPHLLLIRRPDGSLNVSDLIKPSVGPPGPPFKGVVTLADGSVQFKNLDNASTNLPSDATVSDVDAVLDASDHPILSVNCSMLGEEGVFGALSVLARLDTEEQSGRADIALNGLSVPNAAQYAPLPRRYAPTSGVMDIDLGVKILPKMRPDFSSLSGVVRIAGLNSPVPDSTESLREVEAQIRVAGESAILDVRGKFAGSEVRVVGAASGLKDPTTDIAVSAKGIDLARLMRSVKLPAAARKVSARGRGWVVARLRGPVSDPVVRVRAMAPNVEYAIGPGQTFVGSNINVTGTYADSVVQLDSLSMMLMGAQVGVSGSLEIDRGSRMGMRGHVSGLRVSNLPLPAALEPAGSIGAQFQIGGSPGEPEGRAAGTLARGQVAGVSFGPVSADFALEGTTAVIHRLIAADVGGGILKAKGRVSAKKLDVAVSADGIDLGEIGRALGQPGVEGIAYFTGTINGTVQNPRADGVAELFAARYVQRTSRGNSFGAGAREASTELGNGEARDSFGAGAREASTEPGNGEGKDYRLDYAKADFAGDRRGITMREAKLRLYPAQLDFSGQVDNYQSRRVRYDVEGTMQRLGISKIEDLTGTEYGAIGTFGADFKSSGVFDKRPSSLVDKIRNMALEAQLHLSDGVYLEYPISTAQASLSLVDGVILLTSAKVTSEEAKIVASGAVGVADKSVDVTFAATDLDFARVRQDPKIRDSAGQYVVIKGIGGVQGTVDGTLDDLRVDVAANADNVSFNGKLYDSARVQAVYLHANPDSDAATDESGGPEEETSRDSSQRVGITPREPVSKVQSATFTLKRDQQSLDLQAVNIDLNSMTIDSCTGNVSALVVSDLWEVFLFSPYLETERGSSLKEALSAVPRISGGVMDATLELSGSLKAPDGAVSLKAADIGVDIQNVDTMNAKVSAKSGVFSLSNLLLTSADANLSASGDYSTSDGQLLLDLSLQSLDLNRLRPWMGKNTPTGMVAADFRLNGDAKAPHVIGSLEVSSPSYGGITLDGIRASQIEITNDRVTLPTNIIFATGQYQATMGGYLPWDWNKRTVPVDRPLEIVANVDKQSMQVLSRFAPIFDDAGTKGDIHSRLVFGGTANQPSFDGYLRVDDGRIAVKGFVNAFDKINVDIGFESERAKVNAFSLASTSGGTVSVKPGGYVKIGGGEPGEIDVQVVADGFRVQENNMLGFQETLKLGIDAGISVTGSVAKPKIADFAADGKPGGITVRDTLFAFRMPEKMPDREQATYAIDPEFDLTLRLGDNVRVSPPMMTVLAGGGGVLKGTLSKMDLDTVFEVKQGYINLASTRLRVVPGGTVSVRYNPPAEPDVEVDFHASTYVNAKNQFGNRERYLIDLTATGAIADMDIQLMSTPEGLSREQILAALGHVEGILNARGSGTDIQNELRNVLTAVGSSTLFAPLEQLFVEKLGFEQFSLEYSRTDASSVYISRRLAQNLFVSYYQRLKTGMSRVSDSAYELNLIYKLKGQYQVTLGVDDQQTVTSEASITRSF